MCHLVLAYVTSTSLAVYSHAEAVDELPFPVSALLCSLSSYVKHSGWNLQHVSLQDCSICYYSGVAEVLWVIITSNLLLKHEHLQNTLQVADSAAQVLLGPDVCSQTLSLRQHMKGIAPLLDSLFSSAQQQPHGFPLLSLALPRQTILQPSAAAAALPRLLQDLCSVTAGQVQAAALLLYGKYCCATSSWQSHDKLQLLVLQWLAYKHCHLQQVEHGELPLPGLATPTTGTCRLHWIALQPGLQLCVLAGHSYVHGQFVSDIQQVLNSHKGGMAVEALRLPTPVTAITIIDSHWVTCNSATPNDGCRAISANDSWWQMALLLMGWQQQSQLQAVLLNSGEDAGANTVVGLPTSSSNTAAALLRVQGDICLSEAEVLLRGILPAGLLGE